MCLPKGKAESSTIRPVCWEVINGVECAVKPGGVRVGSVRLWLCLGSRRGQLGALAQQHSGAVG